MSKTHNTDRRRNRDDYEQFSGERYGNKRRQMSEMKRRDTRRQRAQEKREVYE
jgi:hypothetical protein